MYPRILTLPQRWSCLLLGPRQTGKSTLVGGILAPSDLTVNLLQERTFQSFVREPGLFHDQASAHLTRHPRARVLVDEVQRLPALLNDVHDLIERHGEARFILTGSSARKLRRGAANLLAGRARALRLFPLVHDELGDAFELEAALRYGCLPWVWRRDLTAADRTDFLDGYVHTYLREEIREEGALRSLGPFTRLLDLAALQDGELVNFTALGRDCGVSVKTAQAYYQILEDTFLVHRVEPWSRSRRRRMVAHPRYYFFDTGVTNALCRVGPSLDRVTRGRRFEQFVMLQVLALAHYRKWQVDLAFWRTQSGQEVDLVLARGDRIVAAIEVKSGARVGPPDAAGLVALREDYPEAATWVVTAGERRQRLGDTGVTATPWRTLLDEDLPACLG